jgi:hypothetical protein
VEADIPEMRVLRPDGMHRIGANFAKERQGSLEVVLCIKRLIKAWGRGWAIALHVNHGSRSVVIQRDRIRFSSFARQWNPSEFLLGSNSFGP